MRANRYVDGTAPWALKRANDPRLTNALYNLIEALRLISHAIWSVTVFGVFLLELLLQLARPEAALIIGSAERGWGRGPGGRGVGA